MSDRLDLDNPFRAEAYISAGSGEHKRIRHLLIGLHEAIIQTINDLYALGYARPDEWSEIIPAPNYPPGVMMSILSRYTEIRV
ncbi:hypothetical protein [Leptolyngbya sp. FACHB-261]|uniref:hypothetical protein n=1 Tax=Leptolyngbya sp. FACHB-261 TaxID=2692806 RepID=UPI001683F244|nr:hypothetical protein [Leptolyngbya sp. FACHB-261]MBD2099804.1 hypothetical protein [Leptolyngbya sp. FACHB-261]